MYVFTTSVSGGSMRSSITVLSTPTGASVGSYDFPAGYLDIRVMETSFSGQYLYIWGRQSYQTPCATSASADRPVFMRLDTGASGTTPPFSNGVSASARQLLVYGDPIRLLADLTVLQRIDGTEYAVVGFAGSSVALEVVKLDTTAVPASFLYTTFKTVTTGNTQRPVAGLNNAVFSALRAATLSLLCRIRSSLAVTAGFRHALPPASFHLPLASPTHPLVCLLLQRNSASYARTPPTPTTPISSTPTSCIRTTRRCRTSSSIPLRAATC